MSEHNDNDLQEYVINDEEPDIIRKTEEKAPSIKKKIIITLIIITLIFIILIVTVIFLSNSNEGRINCIYYISNISDISNNIQILSKDFKKNSNIDIIINGKKQNKFKNTYKLENFENNIINITFHFNNNINLDKMFKDISYLISVEMEGRGNLKITSMRSTFENCSNLKIFNISGFDIHGLKSVHKLFYKTKSLEKINLENFKNNNIEDMSFLFAESKICDAINFTNLISNKVSNISNIFFGCESLNSTDIINYETFLVNDASSMFENCKSLTSLNISNFNTEKVISMKNMFKNCTSLKY